jgi:DNA sulfur modification protein DndB
MIHSRMVLPCLRGVIGDWVYYSSLMTAKQVSEWVIEAKKIREAATLDEELQRDLKERKKGIAKYLLSQDSRFFNSIIIGVFEGVPDWYEFEFGSNSRLPLDANEAEYLKDSVGFLVFDGTEKMFAIDGQHRVAGIEIAYGQDQEKQKELQKLNEDQFSVLLVAHIDDIPGMKRTRKLFSDININAKPVAQGDRIKIDEQNLNAVVTRRLYAKYPKFQKKVGDGNLISLTENAKLDNDDITHFTNLLGLYNVCKTLRGLYKKVSKTNEWDEVNAVPFYDVTEKFFDETIANVNDFKSYFIDKTLTLQKARTKNSYLLFRPIGLRLLARLYVYFEGRQNVSLLFERINNISFIFPKSPLNKILWNNGRIEAKAKNQSVAFYLCLHLLGQLGSEETEVLRVDYQEILKDPEAVLPKKLFKA